MSFVQSPTYLLAPNWTFRPGGKIALGNIVVDPFKPHRVLSQAAPAEAIPAEPVVETNWRLALETARSMSLSIWAVFLENIRLGTDINRERIRNSEFTMTSLETVYLQDDPSEAEIKARCNDPSVRDFMRLGHTLCKPVYMVTGLKIAKGFSLQTTRSDSTGASVEAGAEVAPGASVGGRVGASQTKTISQGFEAEGDIIFAYQLLKISPKGWGKDKTFVGTEYQPRQAFLSSEEGASPEDAPVEGELDSVSAEDLEGFGSAVQILKVDGDGTEGICVAFKK